MTTLSTNPAPARPRPSAEVVVACSNLSKTFRDFWMRHRVRAVEGISFDIYRGEVFGLLGPNGSGKSTTIKMILGLLRPTAGRISVLGKLPEDVATKHQIGYLPEESYLYRFLNARETLDYYGRLFHLPRRIRMRRIDSLLDMVGLQAVQHRPVGEFSKGMQRRIGFAQALINDPQLVILDEPTTGLDPIGTRQIKDLILHLAQPRNNKPGKTILLCSHLLADVEDVCQRISIMFGGKIRALGTLDDLLTRQDMTTLQTSSLDEQTLSEVSAFLEKRGMPVQAVQRPRRPLESLFLEIVHKAHAEGAATAGAGAGGRIAEFLGEEDAQGQQVIDNLVAARSEPESAPAAAAVAPIVPAPAKADEQVLQSLLTQPSTPTRAPASEAAAVNPPPTPAPVADEVDQGVINDLLGGSPNDGKSSSNSGR